MSDPTKYEPKVVLDTNPELPKVKLKNDGCFKAIPGYTSTKNECRQQPRIGDHVRKVSGYKWPGVIVAMFHTTSNQLRFVVECTVPEVAGALHIYSEDQLEIVGPGA